jgi:DNA-binding NarL/FixJ family response regulator
MFFGTREEREEYVFELYQQGKSIREIAQEIHMSFSDIGAIIRKAKA